MKIMSLVRTTGCAVAVVAVLVPALLSAQEQISSPSQGSGLGPTQMAPLPSAPVGHRQPRAGDIPVTDKTAAELLEERQQAELTRKLRICRNC
jgi:hypothetical protein